MARCSGSCAAYCTEHGMLPVIGVCYHIELHDSSDIVRACVRSHESAIEYTCYVVRIDTVLVTHGPKYRRSSYTAPATGFVTRWSCGAGRRASDPEIADANDARRCNEMHVMRLPWG